MQRQDQGSQMPLQSRAQAERGCRARGSHWNPLLLFSVLNLTLYDEKLIQLRYQCSVYCPESCSNWGLSHVPPLGVTLSLRLVSPLNLSHLLLIRNPSAPQLAVQSIGTFCPQPAFLHQTCHLSPAPLSLHGPGSEMWAVCIHPPPTLCYPSYIPYIVSLRLTQAQRSSAVFSLSCSPLCGCHPSCHISVGCSLFCHVVSLRSSCSPHLYSFVLLLPLFSLCRMRNLRSPMGKREWNWILSLLFHCSPKSEPPSLNTPFCSPRCILPLWSALASGDESRIFTKTYICKIIMSCGMHRSFIIVVTLDGPNRKLLPSYSSPPQLPKRIMTVSL